LKVGDGGARRGIADRDGIRIDQHALLQGFLRQMRGKSGMLHAGSRVAAIVHHAGVWTVTTERGEIHSAPVLINAAGAWADRIAVMAGVMPIGLQPKRRTIITFDAPAGTDVSALPFTKTVGDELYFGAEGGRVLASPMDEVPSEPCDAQPDDYEVALAAFRMEERTIAKVDRIHSKWSGLRSFTPDRRPAVGFDDEAEGFFWLAGQGGFGLQTSPAMAAIAASLIDGRRWPIADVSAGELSPRRFG